jgi:hypothetical protein
MRFKQFLVELGSPSNIISVDIKNPHTNQPIDLKYDAGVENIKERVVDEEGNSVLKLVPPNHPVIYFNRLFEIKHPYPDSVIMRNMQNGKELLKEIKGEIPVMGSKVLGPENNLWMPIIDRSTNEFFILKGEGFSGEDLPSFASILFKIKDSEIKEYTFEKLKSFKSELRKMLEDESVQNKAKEYYNSDNPISAFTAMGPPPSKSEIKIPNFSVTPPLTPGHKVSVAGLKYAIGQGFEDRLDRAGDVIQA